MKVHEGLTKKQWLILLNVLALALLASSGRLTSSRQSFVAYSLALIVVNGVAVITVSNYSGWK